MSRLQYSSTLRGYIRTCDRVRAALITRPHEKSLASEMQTLRRLMSYLDVPLEDADQVLTLVQEVGHAHDLPPQELLATIDALGRAKALLRKELASEYGELSTPQPGEERRLFLDLRERANATKEVRLRLLQEIVFDRPGLNLTELERVFAKSGRVPIRYATIWNYVEELESLKLIITIGGSRGYERYCFPHPSKVNSWNRYYHQFFCIEGSVERDLSAEFEQTMAPWRDIFLVNHQVRPTLVVTKFGQAPLHIGEKLRCFGELLALKDAKISGLTPRLRTADIPAEVDVIYAAQITRGASDEVLYRDPDALKRRAKLVAA